jgi:hypothetical protein
MLAYMARHSYLERALFNGILFGFSSNLSLELFGCQLMSLTHALNFDARAHKARNNNCNAGNQAKQS